MTTGTTVRRTPPGQPMPGQQAPVRPGGPGAPARRPGGGATLARLRRTRVVLTVAALVVGAIGAVTVQSRSDGAQDALKHSGPLTQHATVLYHKLSDADATAATLYLHSGPAPTDLLKRFQTDMTEASDALTALTAEAAGAGDAAADIAKVSESLPVYAQDMGYARSISNYGFPLGTRYLIAASNLMQGDPNVQGDKGILGAAKNLVDTESRNLVGAEDKSSAFPAVEALAVALFLILLLYVQIGERARTKRLLNVGLVAATGALVLSALWLGAAFGVQNSEVSMAKKDGSDQVAALAAAQVKSLQARTDEMLTLVGRGTANDRQTDYAKVVQPALAQDLRAADTLATDQQADQLARKAINDATAWDQAHVKLRTLDDQNKYAAAVASALGDPPDDSTTADAAFQALQHDLDDAIAHAQAGFQTHSQSAADAVTGAAVGMGLLGLVMAGAVVAGLGRRISEYQ